MMNLDTLTVQLKCKPEVWAKKKKCEFYCLVIIRTLAQRIITPYKVPFHVLDSVRNTN